MPLAAKKYNPEMNAPAGDINSTVPWHQWRPLVEHFGPVAMAQPERIPRRLPQPIEPELPKPASTTLRIKPRRATHHRPFNPKSAIIWVCCTVGTLLVGLLGIQGATLQYSRQNADTIQKIKVTNEAIDNANKNIAAIQVSPELAQWAMTHGWHVATQADIDEVPAQPQAGD